jgi:hypothetical protein
MSSTLAIDFGSRNIGLALIDHSGPVPNRVLYAATFVVDAKWLNARVTTRVQARRIRRTRKTHQRRLQRLSQALQDVPDVGPILRFCRRRGYSYDEPEDTDPNRAFHVSRERFFEALEEEIRQRIAPPFQRRVLLACEKHLNRQRRRETELRPARFENRHPSKCQWVGCRRNVPRAGNDCLGRVQQALYVWMKPVFDDSPDPDRLRRSVDHWITELDALAHCYAKIERKETLDEERKKRERQLVDRRKRRVFQNLRTRVRQEASAEVAESFEKNWSKTYCRSLTDILRGKQGGRVRYCREHSRLFVDFFLGGRPIPNRTAVDEADLISRKQQIVFSALWRLVEGRLLPLAGGQIDRVVVERVAFDLLAGPVKKRLQLSEARAAEMYWHGPQYGFADRREMLRNEFGGRCAYCGQETGVQEVEHILPRSQFPFDSYLNILPACSACNARKGARTALSAGMKVHRDAYDAYAKYVDSKRPPHLFHTIKKGLLNLLSQRETSPAVEWALGMLADNLVNITRTQQAPRPLARFLAGKIEKTTGKPCQADYTAGRHTALYRSILLPEYDKSDEKQHGDLTNHAVDAVLLGCRLPSAAAMENPRWHARIEDINSWRRQVIAAGPAIRNDRPCVEAVEPIPYFEENLGDGYFSLRLSAFNWNQSRKAAHGLDPVGKTSTGSPIKREPAAEVLANLKNASTRSKQIDRIAHRALRQYLQADAAQAAERLVRWLQQTIRAGLARSVMSNHPADQSRKRLLEEFVSTPAEAFLADQDAKAIPHIIGIRCLALQSSAKYDVPRCDQQGRPYQYFTGDPRWKAFYVGYRLSKGHIDRSRPIVFSVNQIDAVTKLTTSGNVPIDVPPDSPLHGRLLGAVGSRKEFRQRWQQAFDELCRREGIAKIFCLLHGCVIEKTNGTRFQLRNFDKRGAWMKGSPFQHIRRVYASPFKVWKEHSNGNMTPQDHPTPDEQK